MPIRKLIRIVVLLTLTLMIQIIGLPQLITGPLINMMLLITALILDPVSGIILGVITPMLALLRGQLPPVLAPMVPFIMVGNAILVGVFSVIRGSRHKNILTSVQIWIALILASLCKTLWLFLTARFLLPLLLGRQLPELMILAMSFPQFVTAVAGGILALIIYELLHRRSGLPGGESNIIKDNRL